MGVAADKFEAATPVTSGVTRSHLRDIHNACRQMHTFVIVRPSTPATMRLIDAGFATKSMDIHDKSSDWGLTSGLVPVDQAFSKNCDGKTPNDRLHPHGHGEAQAVHLGLRDSFEKLNAQQHFEHMTEVHSGPCTTAHALTRYRHFHCNAKNARVCFVLERGTGKVYWHWRNKAPAALVAVLVWGYSGTPVTGDYDLSDSSIVVRNPKWLHGVTLGVEDMAAAADQFPDDKGVKAGVAEMKKLEESVAVKLQRLRRGKTGTASTGLAPDTHWNDRCKQLRYFRAIGRMPDATQSPETLMLPTSAFPSSGPGSGTESLKEVTAMGKEMETKFGRTGFVQEDGHVSLVDRSVGGSSKGRVQSLVRDWERRKG